MHTDKEPGTAKASDPEALELEAMEIDFLQTLSLIHIYLKNPFSMFSGITQQRAAEPDRFNRVVIFPVPADDAKITHGVIVFMP